MSGASDLIENIFQWGDTIKDDTEFFRKYQPEALVYMCAKEVERVVRTAWHPVSEPPTEADGDVLLMWSDRALSLEDVDIVRSLTDTGLFWAWPCDVVLMPPQGGE